MTQEQKIIRAKVGLLEVELAKSAAYYAAASLDDGDREAVANAHLAKACASDIRMCKPPFTRCRSTAASASPGTMTRISGSNGQKAPRCCWAMPTITAN